MKRPTIYLTDFAAPHSRRLRLGRWTWWITDSLTGPVLVRGTARTEWGALRRLERALRRCCSEQERLDGICARLHAEGIDVEAHYDEQHRVCVRPLCACSDRDHRRVMREFLVIASAVLWEVSA